MPWEGGVSKKHGVTYPSSGGSSGSSSGTGSSGSSNSKEKKYTYTDSQGNVHAVEDYTKQGGGHYDTVISGPATQPGGGSHGSIPERQRAQMLQEPWVQAGVVQEAGRSPAAKESLLKAGIIEEVQQAHVVAPQAQVQQAQQQGSLLKNPFTGEMMYSERPDPYAGVQGIPGKEWLAKTREGKVPQRIDEPYRTGYQWVDRPQVQEPGIMSSTFTPDSFTRGVDAQLAATGKFISGLDVDVSKALNLKGYLGSVYSGYRESGRMQRQLVTEQSIGKPVTELPKLFTESKKGTEMFVIGAGKGLAEKPVTTIGNVAVAFLVTKGMGALFSKAPVLAQGIGTGRVARQISAANIAGAGMVGLYGADVGIRVSQSPRPAMTLGEITSTEIIPFAVGGYIGTKPLPHLPRMKITEINKPVAIPGMGVFVKPTMKITIERPPTPKSIPTEAELFPRRVKTVEPERWTGETKFEALSKKEVIPSVKQFYDLKRNQIETAKMVERATGKEYDYVRGVELMRALEKPKLPVIQKPKYVPKETKAGTTGFWETKFEADMHKKPVKLMMPEERAGVIARIKQSHGLYVKGITALDMGIKTKIPLMLGLKTIHPGELAMIPRGISPQRQTKNTDNQRAFFVPIKLPASSYYLGGGSGGRPFSPPIKPPVIPRVPIGSSPPPGIPGRPPPGIPYTPPPTFVFPKLPKFDNMGATRKLKGRKASAYEIRNPFATLKDVIGDL